MKSALYVPIPVEGILSELELAIKERFELCLIIVYASLEDELWHEMMLTTSFPSLTSLRSKICCWMFFPSSCLK
jgi:hypothetical protein